jgi:hypothetical protein
MQSADVTFPKAATLHFFFYRQGVHALFIVVLLPVAWGLAAPALGGASYLGISDRWWFAASLACAVVHQLWIWTGWRAQLGWRAFTRGFGSYDFAVFSSVFFALLVMRPLLIATTSIAGAGTLLLPPWLSLGLGVLLSAMALYTGWSVVRYFGLARAAGADHFRPGYREMGLVNQGVFALVPNAMYTFGFLGLWAIALLARSHVGLVAALFQHAYVWVHYLCTESPDMDVLYG